MVRCFALLSGIAVAMGLCQAMGSEASKLKYPRPGPCSCVPNAQNFGFFPTQWRRWPCEQRPEISDPRSIGATVLPTPEPKPEEPPPPAAPLLPMPSEGGGILPPPGEGILPPPGEAPSGPEAAPSLELPPALQLTPPTTPTEPGPGLPGLPAEPKNPVPTPNGAQHRSEDHPPVADDTPDKAGHATAKAAAFQQPADVPPAASAIADVAAPSPPDVPLARPEEVSARSSCHDAVAAKIPVVPPDETSAGNVCAKVESPATVETKVEKATRSSKKAPTMPAVDTTNQPSTEDTAVAAATAVPTVALEGYCPVELLRNGRWIAGDLRWTVVYGGHIYRLSGPAQRQAFLENPEAFAPVGSGNDPVLAVDEHSTVPGKSAHCAVYDGRLYMFATAASQAKFNEQPERYAGK